MDILHNLAIGFAVAVNPINVLYCFIDPRVRLRTGRRLHAPELLRHGRRASAGGELTEPAT